MTQFTNLSDPPLGVDVENAGQGVDNTVISNALEEPKIVTTSHIVGGEGPVEHHDILQTDDLIDQSPVTHEVAKDEQAGGGDENPDRSVTPTQMHVISHGSSAIGTIVVGEAPPVEAASDNKALVPDHDFVNPKPDYDILNEIPNMYRLLDIINDGGDKAVIHHESISRISNKLKPGSYSSMSKIDFQALDESVISPMGIYGSRLKLIAWLLDSGVVTKDIAGRLAGTQLAIAGSRGLSPGMYLLQDAAPRFYVIFWPEESTWEARDTADAGKNRVLFMRYLTKLCHQITCLVCDEDVAKIVDTLGWNRVSKPEPSPATRLFQRKVTRLVEQEESAVGTPGPTYRLDFPSHYQADDLECLPNQTPRLVEGNERQGLVVSSIRWSREVLGETKERSRVQMQNWLFPKENTSCGILLDANIDERSLKVLLDIVLRERFAALYQTWEIERDQAIAKQRETQDAGVKHLEELLERSTPLIHTKLAHLAYSELLKRYPHLSPFNWHEFEPHSLFPDTPATVEDLFDTTFAIQSNQRLLPEYFSKFSWDQYFRNDDALFPLSKGKKQEPLDQVNPPTRHQSGTTTVTVVQTSSVSRWDHIRSTGSRWLHYLPSRLPTFPFISSDPIQGGAKPHDELYATTDDRSSLYVEASGSEASLGSGETHPPNRRHLVLSTAWNHAITGATDLVRGIICKHREEQMNRILDIEQQSAWKDLAARLNQELRREAKREVMVIYGVVQNSKDRLSFLCQKTKASRRQIVLMLYELSLGSSGESCLEQLGPVECPTPESLKYIRFVGRDHLMTLVNEGDRLVAQIHVLGSKHRKHDPLHLHASRLGASYLFDFDEASKRLAFVVNEDNLSRLLIHESNGQKFNSLAPILLEGFPFTGNYEFAHVCFLPQGKTLVFSDSVGQIALYSLLSNQFRPSGIALGVRPSSIQRTPDGSCILTCTRIVGDEAELRVIHVASFAQRPQGFLLKLHSKMIAEGLALAKIGSSPKAHLISLHHGQVHTWELHITSKAADYAFQSFGGLERPESVGEASLIHCFNEVWIRYPIVAAVDSDRHAALLQSQTRHVHFVTSAHPAFFAQEFIKQIKQFERQLHKPTCGRLAALDVSASSQFDPSLLCSEFSFGDWLAGLFCLIPIHIAITNANQFVPLKDGSSSGDLGEAFAGDGVEQLANSLSFGWYESIFASYFAKKPVRVVSSMGEQSVGKSYALNHLADTSFAGSAMRCTEGAWLSVTPCTQELLVTLDFEGINSIERSKQEDMLMVLFQTAISNLVLLRTHSAMSRNLNKLLSGFQHSSTTFNPDANPTLFQSMLALIIRDVPDEDTAGTLEEFDEKLGRIVAEEQDGNFLSRLHRGDLVIVPWPMMSSPAFYHTFEDIKKLLHSRPIIHSTGGEFLGVLKMLMAQIQASDWRAIENSLGSQRANLLSQYMPDALRYGRTDLSARGLTVLDTDEILSDSTAETIFFASNSGSTDQPSDGLRTLCKGWPKYQLRAQMTEEDFIGELGLYLQRLLESRIDLVEIWINRNTTRFRECPDVQELHAKYKQQSQTLRSKVIICGMGCESCGRRCINSQRHSGSHDCDTNHTCPDLCEFEDGHDANLPPCRLHALHPGRHVCQEVNHHCGKPCVLMGLGNCLRTCTKSIDHCGENNDEHMCDANKHTCAQMCDLASSGLQQSDIPICGSKCNIDYLQPHDQHCCERSSNCPFLCALCDGPCAVRDHLHGLQNDCIHLCSGTHRCRSECEMPGICEVKPQPRSVEETYFGQLESFQYTLYTQQAHRLPCAIPIPAGSLKHAGLHQHNGEFHYCEVQCPQCEYYCTLPLGHPSQQEHETSHGNMKKTKWRMEGDQTVVNGRRYANEDPGVSMYCSIICSELGRHAHLAECKVSGAQCLGGDDSEHIPKGISDKDDVNFDWISHRLFWERSGFRDPYSRQQRGEFSKCDHTCPGDEHKGTEPSYCVLPLFHPPSHEDGATAGQYVSANGHVFECDDPSYPPCHVIFAIDRSWSMSGDDRTPHTQWPGIPPISDMHNNRYGAVLSALYRFLNSVQTSRMAQKGSPRDAYSCVLFNSFATVPFVHNEVNSNEELLRILLEASVDGGTNFNNALDEVKKVMTTNWSDKRLPVVIFLSDGEDQVDSDKMRNLCESAVNLGKPLAFYSISFGQSRYTSVLQTMAQTARDVYRTAAVSIRQIPCEYKNALDTVQLESIFLEIAESLRLQRASLILK